jgi:hypothetical protein
VILEAVLILGVGLVFGVFIALANKRLWVWEDPRIDVVAQMLPNAQHRACCRAVARSPSEPWKEGDASAVPYRATRRGADRQLPGVDAGDREACGGCSALVDRTSRISAEYRGLPLVPRLRSRRRWKGCAWAALGSQTVHAPATATRFR